MRTLSINGTVCGNDITLLSIDYGYATVTTYQDWLRNSLDPLYYGQDTQYTTANIELLVEAENIGALEEKCSNVYASMRKAVIKDSAVSFSLDGVATGIQEQRLGPKARTLTITFQGVKIEDKQTKNLTLSLTNRVLEVSGNTQVATAITIHPERSYVTLTIVINDREYVLTNIEYENNTEIVIDGINGTVTKNGESYIDHYDSWELPRLDAGENQIRCLEGVPSVTFEFSGKWV
jgi:hypothetical protein